MKPEAVLCPKPEGLYCAPGDFFIDPVRPVERTAMIARVSGVATTTP